MMLLNFILPIIQTAKQQVWLQIFTIYVRYLIGGAFVIAAIGMGKISGEAMPIADMSKPIQDLHPLQQFFRVMAISGLYWHFIGWSQIACGAMLMLQRWAKLGAVIFFVMMLNIFLITLSFDFRGTPIITGLMLLACTYLLLWDLKELQYVIASPNPALVASWKEPALIQKPFWAWVGVLMLISVLVLAYLRFDTALQLLVPFLEGFIAFLVYWVNRKRFR